MSDRKNRFALINEFEKRMRMEGLSPPPLNKYNEQWAADALLESFDYDDIIKSMNYYFSINARPTWKGFANNIDKLLESMRAKEEDNRLRAERRRMAKEWLSEQH